MKRGAAPLSSGPPTRPKGGSKLAKSSLSELVKSLAEQCDAEVTTSNAAIGGKDECTEDQIAAIVERVCLNNDHLTDAAVRDDVRAAMKSKAYVFEAAK